MAQYGTTEWYLKELKLRETAYDLALEGLRQKGKIGVSFAQELDGIHAEAVTELKRQKEIAYEEYQKAAEKDRLAGEQIRYELEAKRTVKLLKELAEKCGKTIEEVLDDVDGD